MTETLDGRYTPFADVEAADGLIAARDEILQQDVDLLLLDPIADPLERAHTLREMRRNLRAVGPGVAEVADTGTLGARPFLVMTSTGRPAWSAGEQLDSARGVRIVLDVLEGMRSLLASNLSWYSVRAPHLRVEGDAARVVPAPYKGGLSEDDSAFLAPLGQLLEELVDADADPALRTVAARVTGQAEPPIHSAGELRHILEAHLAGPEARVSRQGMLSHLLRRTPRTPDSAKHPQSAAASAESPQTGSELAELPAPAAMPKPALSVPLPGGGEVVTVSAGAQMSHEQASAGTSTGQSGPAKASPTASPVKSSPVTASPVTANPVASGPVTASAAPASPVNAVAPVAASSETASSVTASPVQAVSPPAESERVAPAQTRTTHASATLASAAQPHAAEAAASEAQASTLPASESPAQATSPSESPSAPPEQPTPALAETPGATATQAGPTAAYVPHVVALSSLLPPTEDEIEYVSLSSLLHDYDEEVDAQPAGHKHRLFSRKPADGDAHST